MHFTQVNPPKHAAGRPGRMSAGRAKSSEPTAGVTPAELTLGEPRKRLDRSRRGSHAGLERIEVELFRHGVMIGWLDVHLHHNQGHISVGATLRIQKSQMKGSP